MSDSVDSVTLACRACGAKNRLPLEKTLRNLAEPRCGRCRLGLFLVSGEALPHVGDGDLAHPWDREALEKLKAIPYADKLLSKVLGATLDKLTRFRLTASAVRVTERQAPRLLALYHEAAGRVNVDPPPLFIQQAPILNAFTMGGSQPMVAVTSGLLDAFGDREVVGVLGHELTHVKLGHVLYRTLAVLLLEGGVGLLGKFLGVAKLLAVPLQVALMRWYQMAELSADRGELLAAGSLETSVRIHMLLSGGASRFDEELDVGAFVDQANEAERLREEDLFVYALEMMGQNDRTHPLPAWRVHHAMKWARSEAFLTLLAGHPAPRLEQLGETAA